MNIERLRPDAARILRSKPGMARLRLAHDAWELARDRLTAYCRARHPGWSEERVVWQEVAARLGRFWPRPPSTT
jgi:hypothetical protein